MNIFGLAGDILLSLTFDHICQLALSSSYADPAFLLLAKREFRRLASFSISLSQRERERERERERHFLDISQTKNNFLIF